MYSFSYWEPVCCSMSSSNCCFLTCMQVSQEAGQVVWYFHLFQNFPQFIVVHTVKGFGIINKVDYMWVCFWAHCSVPFICVSVLSLVPCCFGCCISMVSLKSSNVSFLSLVFSHFSHNIVMTILSRILTGIAVNM